MTNNKQQTTVEWIEQEMLKGNLSLKEILEQAKEMEKENTRRNCEYWEEMGILKALKVRNRKTFEQWHEEVYGGNNQLCCTPEGQIKRYVNCIGCDRKPLIEGGNK
jgi:Fe2+ or Zn2+ uptake regulation protein